MSKTCVIVSPYFPPSTLAGVHRARHLAKHLPAVGWNPIILCVDEAYHVERLDPGLASLVPQSVEIVKVRALSARVTRCFGLSEISLRAFRSLRRSLCHLCETRQIDAVFITGSPYYPMLLANTVKRRFGVPVVLDFQDPWVSAWGASQPKLSKAGLSHILGTLLEPRALRGASYITSVSATQNLQLADRYPWVDPKRMAAVPIGCDPEDFEALRGMAPGNPDIEFDSTRINISYVGTFMPRSVALMDTLMRGVLEARQARPEVLSKLTLNFIGTSSQPNEPSTFRVLPLALAHRIDDIVREIPQRVPYLEALSVLARSDGILMVGSDEPHYTASKIYPALMSGRPYLSLFHRASSAYEILSEAGGGISLAFSSRKELEGMGKEICDGVIRLAASPNSLGRADPAIYGAYEAATIAGRFADIFDIAVAENS